MYHIYFMNYLSGVNSKICLATNNNLCLRLVHNTFRVCCLVLKPEIDIANIKQSGLTFNKSFNTILFSKKIKASFYFHTFVVLTVSGDTINAYFYSVKLNDSVKAVLAEKRDLKVSGFVSKFGCWISEYWSKKSLLHNN